MNLTFMPECKDCVVVMCCSELCDKVLSNIFITDFLKLLCVNCPKSKNECDYEQQYSCQIWNSFNQQFIKHPNKVKAGEKPDRCTKSYEEIMPW